MARWTLLGSARRCRPPLIVTALFYFGYGWRGMYLALAFAVLVYTGCCSGAL